MSAAAGEVAVSAASAARHRQLPTRADLTPGWHDAPLALHHARAVTTYPRKDGSDGARRGEVKRLRGKAVLIP